MKRLTEKICNEYNPKTYEQWHIRKCIKKLGKLEDLEEQIGMPLEDFFNKVGREKMEKINGKD